MLFPLLTHSRRIPRPESDGTHWPPIAFEQIPNGAGHCSQALPFIRLISQLLLVTSHSWFLRRRSPRPWRILGQRAPTAPPIQWMCKVRWNFGLGFRDVNVGKFTVWRTIPTGLRQSRIF